MVLYLLLVLYKGKITATVPRCQHLRVSVAHFEDQTEQSKADQTANDY